MQKILTALLLAADVGAFAPSSPFTAKAPALRVSEEDLKAQIMNADAPTYNVLGGIDECDMEIPGDCKFELPVLAKVMGKYDGEFELTVSDGEAKAGGHAIDVDIVPDSMTLEDFYAGFAEGAPAWMSVTPNVGRLERKGGEPVTLSVLAAPSAGETFEGEVGLVVVLPDDIDKCYKINVKVGDGVATSEFDNGSDGDSG